jgi:beta-lactamase class D
MKETRFILIIIISSSLTVYGQYDMARPFKDCGIDGSITIYDYQANKWICSDIYDSHFQTLPASTFKIINTLIALESEVIVDENEIIKWPGSTDTVKYGYRPTIYHDMNVSEAFRSSAGWVYLELAKKIGKEKYAEFLKSCNYGNNDLSINDDDFWNFGNLAISPVNQIEILIGIYEETLPFRKDYMQIVKNVMIEEKSETFTLRAKTGWARDAGKDTGWWVGYIERENNAYFFATRLIKSRDISNPDFGKCRKEITKIILKQLNIIE